MNGSRVAGLAWGAVVIALLAGFWLRVDALDAMPPGLSNDEAINLIDSAWVARTGRLALYEDIGRPEPLFQFYGALTSLFFGDSVWAFRYASALWGLLALPAMYFASGQCFAHESRTRRRLCGLLAVVVIATAVGHICVSRSLYRAVPLTFFLALVIGFCLRALRRGARSDFVLTAVFLALAIYTYSTALVVPFAFLPLAAALLAFQRRKWRSWLPGLLLTGGVLLLLTAPVLHLLLANPEAVLARAQNVSSGPDVDWARRLQAMLAQFFVQGDENPQYNVADAPLIAQGVAPLFCLGLAALLLRLRQPSAVLLISLLLLNALPTLLTNEITHGLRMYAEFALIPLVAAAGLIPLRRLLQSMLRRERAPALLLFGLVVALFAYLTAETKSIYAEFWRIEARDGRLWRIHGLELSSSEWFFRSDRLALAEWILERDAPLLLPAATLDRPALRAHLMARFPVVQTASEAAFADETLVVLPWSLERGGFHDESRHFALLGGDAITLLPPFSAAGMKTLLRNRDQARPVEFPDSAIPVVAEVFPLGGDAAPVFLEAEGASQPLARFNGELELRQWRGPATIDAAGDFAFSLEWSVARPVSHNYGAFLQLLAPGWQRIAGEDRTLHRWLYPTIAWGGNDRVSVAFQLTLSESLPPGAYRLVAGAWHVNGGLMEAESFVGEAIRGAATIGWIKAPQIAEPRAPAEATPIDASFAGVFRLGHVHAQRSVSPGLTVTSYWIAPQDRQDIDATLFLHAIDAAGDLVAQDDQRPWNGRYPTFIWDGGETVAVEQRLNLDESAGIQLYAGMYTQPDLVRLPALQDGSLAPDDSVYLGRLSALLGEG